MTARAIFLLLSFPCWVQAQSGGFHSQLDPLSKRRFYLLGAIDFSKNHLHFDHEGRVLKKYIEEDKFDLTNLAVSLQYILNRRWSIEAGLQSLEYGSQCVDVAYLARHPENKKALLNLPDSPPGGQVPISQLAFDASYHSFYLSATRYFPVRRKSSFYVSAGAHYNYIRQPFGGITSFHDAVNNEVLTVHYTARPFVGIVGEIGWQTIVFRTYIPIFIGFRYNTGFQKSIEASYTDIQNGQVVNTDYLSSRGSYYGLVIRLGLQVYSRGKTKKSHIDHASNPKHERKPKEENWPRGAELAQRTRVVPVTKDSLARKAEVQHRLECKSNTILVDVYDGAFEDGDVLSLYFNDQMVLSNHILSRKPYRLTLQLKGGVNQVSLHAINEGRYTPCTAVVQVDDGNSKQIVELNSTFTHSGTIEIRVAEPKK
jgi:hypothetical protein